MKFYKLLIALSLLGLLMSCAVIKYPEEIVSMSLDRYYSDLKEDVNKQMAGEGIVLLKNDDDILPLRSDKIAVFGWASNASVFGGYGSGEIGTMSEKVTIIKGIENSGIQVFDELKWLYEAVGDKRAVSTMNEQDWTLVEPDISEYCQGARDHSDVAVVVIGRDGGEGADLPIDMTKVTYYGNASFKNGHYLSLSVDEEMMIDNVCSYFDNVIIIYNGNNVFEFGFIEEYPSIKALLWAPGLGETGFEQLGAVLKGSVNPSGKTNDLFLYDLTKDITFNNSGSHAYEGFGWSSFHPHYVNYAEGVYCGYRFYETAFDEGLAYYDNVQYPFGYGLSYTSFKKKITLFEKKDGVLNMCVSVTNTGSRSGKDVVEIYATPPYYNGGIEKPSVSLVAFDKTDVLKPGGSREIEIEIPLKSLASYDTENETYIVEKGEYSISLRSDSHTVLDEVIFSLDEDVFFYDEKVHNRFDYVAGEIEYLSREDGFANVNTIIRGQDEIAASRHFMQGFSYNGNYSVWSEDAGTYFPKTGEYSDISFSYMGTKTYDDEMWEYFLNNLTVDEMSELVANGGFKTIAIESIKKPEMTDSDGPSAIYNTKTDTYSEGYPVMMVLANTWNKNLAYEYGSAIGVILNEMDVDGWYAPALNLHRSPFGGRNYEYFSSDPHVTSVMGTNIIKAVNEKGRYTFAKHFCLNEQESDRNGMLCTWCNEQAFREIYLKPFEMAVKEGGTYAIMSSFNYIGNRYAGVCGDLLNGVLRDEWGFEGMVISDWYGDYGYQNADQMIRNGNDLCLDTTGFNSSHVKDHVTANGIVALRNASKNILYTTSRSYDYIDYQKQNYTRILTKASKYAVVGSALCLGFFVFVSIKKR